MKRIVSMLLLLSICFICTISASAQTQTSGDTVEEYDLTEYYEDANIGLIIDALPEQSEEFFDSFDLSEMDLSQVVNLNPKDFFSALFSLVQKQVSAPLATLASFIGIILLCTMLKGLQTSLLEHSLSSIYSTVCVLCVSAVLAGPILSCITNAVQAIRDCANFLLTFIPVFSGIVISSGQPVTASTYHLFVFSACQVIAQIAATVLVPLLGMYLAFCMIGSLTDSVNITSIAGVIKKTVSWALGLLLTIFVGLLTVQSLVSAGGDSIAVKTTKFLIGNFVPVVGSALSDGFVAAQGCIKLLKTTVGGFGIVVSAITFIPIIIQVVVWYLVTTVGAAVAEALDVKQVATPLKASGQVLGLLIAIILSFALLVIISTTIILLMGVGS